VPDVYGNLSNEEEVEARMATSQSRVSGGDYAANSRDDDELDRMVSEASVPNLGALMKSALKQGLITPTKGYASA
jgi:hypothetical protein